MCDDARSQSHRQAAYFAWKVLPLQALTTVYIHAVDEAEQHNLRCGSGHVTCKL